MYYHIKGTKRANKEHFNNEHNDNYAKDNTSPISKSNFLDVIQTLKTYLLEIISAKINSSLQQNKQNAVHPMFPPLQPNPPWYPNPNITQTLPLHPNPMIHTTAQHMQHLNIPNLRNQQTNHRPHQM